MTDALQLLAAGAFVLAALVLGLALGAAPWLLRHPLKWLFAAVFALGLVAVGGGDADGSLFRQTTWGGVFVLAVFLAARDAQGRFSWPGGLLPLPLLLLVAYALVSVAWSPSPALSFKRAVQLVGVLALAVAIVRRREGEPQMWRDMAIAAGVFIVLGLLLAAAAPGRAFDAEHALRAMTSHKNTWGQFSLLAAIVFLMLALRRGGRRLAAGGVAALCVASLLLSRSTTSILSFALIGLAVAAWLLWARGGAAGRSVLFATLALVALGAHAYTVLTGELVLGRVETLFYALTGKTPSLTGRTWLWQLMLGEIQRHPWFGIGYGGFWTPLWDSPAKALSLHLAWGPPGQAHSGYLDVVNELGVAGLALLLAALGRHASNLLRLARAGMRQAAGFHGALLVSALIVNYAESSLLRTTHLWWILLCLSMVDVHALARGQRGGAAVAQAPLAGAGAWP